MALDNDRTLSKLCEQREDLRVQLSIATDTARPDAGQLSTVRARLNLLEAEIVDRRRVLGRAQTIQTGPQAPVTH
jgi:hypothetical protein